MALLRTMSTSSTTSAEGFTEGSTGSEGKATCLVHARARPAERPSVSRPTQPVKNGSEMHVRATSPGYLSLAPCKRPSDDTPIDDAPSKKARFSFTAKILRRDPLRGALTPTDKELADEQAIGGLRNIAQNLSRLSYSTSFGQTHGKAIKATLVADMEAQREKGKLDQSWVYQSCAAIGSDKDSGLKPPPDAMAAVERLLQEFTCTAGTDCQSQKFAARR